MRATRGLVPELPRQAWILLGGVGLSGVVALGAFRLERRLPASANLVPALAPE